MFDFPLEFGPYPVGLHVLEQYDRSRVFRPSIGEHGARDERERARPLQTLIWYPSELCESARMTVGDYVDLWATERLFGTPRRPSRSEEWRAGMAAALTQPLRARRDPPRCTGRFPIVIYAPGHSSPSWENADLCEYLASHGYLVLASPSMGASMGYPTLDLAGIDPQARDISFLIGYAHGLPNADTSKIAAAGFSWGALSALFAAARDDRINALIGLDGGFRFHPGLVAQAGHVLPAKMRIPLLSIAQGQWTPEEKARLLQSMPDQDGPDVLNAWLHGDCVAVYLLGLTHGEFSSMSQRNESDWKQIFELFPEKKVDYDRADSVAGYGWLARYTLEFLNAYLKEDATALAFLQRTPAANGVPRRFMTTRFRAAAGPPATFETFREELARRGFEQAAKLFAEFRDSDSTFDLDEYTLTTWATELTDAGQHVASVALAQLNVQLHPKSADAHMTLATAYKSSGDDGLSRLSYQRAVQVGPSWAVSRALIELRTGTP
jgi:dienelactone hydrolase